MDYCDAISLHVYPWGNYSIEMGDVIVRPLGLYRNITQKASR